MNISFNILFGRSWKHLFNCAYMTSYVALLFKDVPKYSEMQLMLYSVTVLMYFKDILSTCKHLSRTLLKIIMMWQSDSYKAKSKIILQFKYNQRLFYPWINILIKLLLHIISCNNQMYYPWKYLLYPWINILIKLLHFISWNNQIYYPWKYFGKLLLNMTYCPAPIYHLPFNYVTFCNYVIVFFISQCTLWHHNVICDVILPWLCLMNN